MLGLCDLQLVLVHFPVSSIDPGEEFLFVDVVVYTALFDSEPGSEELYIRIGRLSLQIRAVSIFRDIVGLWQRCGEGVSSILTVCIDVDVSVEDVSGTFGVFGM